MEKELGMKWFIFFTKIRPWLTIIFWIPLTLQIIENPSIYLKNPISAIICIGTYIQGILGILLTVYSNNKNEQLYRLLHGILIYEVSFSSFQFAVQNSTENLLETLILFFLCLLVYFLVWYKPNIIYFKKRLSIQKSITPETLILKKQNDNSNRLLLNILITMSFITIILCCINIVQFFYINNVISNEVVDENTTTEYENTENSIGTITEDGVFIPNTEQLSPPSYYVDEDGTLYELLQDSSSSSTNPLEESTIISIGISLAIICFQIIMLIILINICKHTN